jgi:transposase
MPPVDRNNPQRAATSESLYSLVEFVRDFPDDATCLEWLWRTRYADDGTHAHCTKCDQARAFKRYDTATRRQSWTCTACGHHVHPTAGTIFHKSSTSLHLWFYAMYLMTSTRCGISAKQLERELGVTYKTAWRMFHLIRNDLMTQDTADLSGEVEADETYIGGRRKGQSGRPKPGATHKTAVFGMVERKGRVVALTVPSVRKTTLMTRMVYRVLPETTVYTDELLSYHAVGDFGYKHRRIRHSEGVYVSGDVHTNTIEGFWSLVKRGIAGTHHAVSAKHLQGYLNEYAWRYNHRNSPKAQFHLLLGRAASVDALRARRLRGLRNDA